MSNYQREPTWEAEPSRKGFNLYFWLLMIPFFIASTVGAYYLADNKDALTAYLIALPLGLAFYYFCVMIIGMVLGFVAGPTAGLLGEKQRERRQFERQRENDNEQ